MNDKFLFYSYFVLGKREGGGVEIQDSEIPLLPLKLLVRNNFTGRRILGSYHNLGL